MISYSKTPVLELHDPLFEACHVRVLVKREDLNHLHISGNKWWKLKNNLRSARQGGHSTLLTFGGAYSNHLYAVAAAAAETGMKSIGVVRGEETIPLNQTLSFARQKGMKLHYVSRALYKEKSGGRFIQELHDRFGDFYFLPEGGTNLEAVLGCREFGEILVNEIPFDILCVPVGTGGTIAGLIQALKPEQEGLGFSVLKEGGFLNEEVRKWLPPECSTTWRIETRFDFGGYAKTTPGLLSFIRRIQSTHDLPLDAVYTGKMGFGIWNMIEQGEIPHGRTVLVVHTGGLQGSVSQTSLPEPP